MYTKHTFLHNEESKTYFISDTHFCHNKPFLYEKRGFKNIKEHDETLIKRWNEIVRPQDNVIHCGDFLLGGGRDSMSAGNEILFQLNGHISFLWGNHNSYVKQIFKESVQEKLPGCDELTEIYPVTYKNKITFYGHYLLAKVKTPKFSQFLFCSHFAHRLWIDSHHGDIWAISGHSHGSDKESNPDYQNIKRLDVGIENFGGPVSFDKIKEIMDSKKIIQIDHHKSSTSRSF